MCGAYMPSGRLPIGERSRLGQQQLAHAASVLVRWTADGSSRALIKSSRVAASEHIAGAGAGACAAGEFASARLQSGPQ